MDCPDEVALLKREVGGVVGSANRATCDLINARSEHLLARAVIEYAKVKGINVTTAEDLRAVPGKGAVGGGRAANSGRGRPASSPSVGRRRTTFVAGSTR